MAGDDDNELFRRAMEQAGVVRRGYKSVRVSRDEPRTPGVGRRQLWDDDQFADLPARRPLPMPLTTAIDRTDNGYPLQFARAGTSKGQWKQLRRGAMKIEESIDLHGMRSHQATRALETFLTECIDYGLQSIEIIHGKGYGSEQPGGVLRPMTIHFLKQQPEVMAFCSAPPDCGGSGATRVLLKTRF